MAGLAGGFWTALGLAASVGPADRAASRPVAGIQAPAGDVPARSVWDGVYTEEQARRGQRLYRGQCADCHTPGEFKKGYRTAYDLFTSLFEMPQAAPGSLTEQEYADLIAYIFEANDLPSGKEELKGDPDVLKQIRIDPEKPAGR